MKRAVSKILIACAAFAFIGCASVPSSHTYSQGISDYPYNDELIVSRFEGRFNSKSTSAEYAFLHCFEVCDDLGYKYTIVSKPTFGKKTRVNMWAESMDIRYYDDNVVEYFFGCSDYEALGSMESGLMATKARLLRVQSEEEQKRRDELRIQNNILTGVTLLVIIFSVVGIGMSVSD